MTTNAQNQQARRPTIGLLCGSLQNEYDANLWLGVRDAARKHGVNALCFPGGATEEDASANVLYDLLGDETTDLPRLDGLVVWGARLSQTPDSERMLTLLRECDRLPMLNLGLAMAGTPGLTYDHRQGMRDIVTHLIEAHGCRRIAYLNWRDERYESQERYRGYADALAAHDIPLDPALVVPDRGGDRRRGGVHILLDERGARPQVDFDALVGCNDRTAMAAAEALLERGFQIPQDVAVAGFDDLAEARIFTPPLATVRHSFVDLGARAVELLLSLMAGEAVPQQTLLPMLIIPRPSCGCLSPVVAQAAAAPDARRVGVLEMALTAQREEMIVEMSREVGGGETLRAAIEQLLDGFIAELRSDSPGAFLLALDEALRLAALDADARDDGLRSRHPLVGWHNLLSALRRRALTCIDDETWPRAESLWQQARVMIDEAAYQAQARRQFLDVNRAAALHAISQAVGRATHIHDLMDSIAQALTSVNWPAYYLSLYEGQERPFQSARLMVAWRRGERLESETGGRSFPALQLLPDDMWPAEEEFTLVALPLRIGEERMGFVLLDIGAQEGTIYEMIRHELSGALYSAALFEERAQAEAAMELAYAEIERQVTERAAALEHEVAERERVQAETVRLHQELIAAQQRIIQELSTPIIPLTELPQGGSVIVAPVVGSVDSLRAREITRRLLAGIREHRAKVVILDLTGVPLVDSGVAAHLSKTIHAARLKGARTIITGLSDAVTETIVDLGIDWSGVETRRDLQTGLRSVMAEIRGGRK